MSEEKETNGWWGEEGGHRLDVEHLGRGWVRLTVTTATQPPSVVTLADWRAHQFWKWYNRVAPLPAVDPASESE